MEFEKQIETEFPERLKGVTEGEVLKVANKAWPEIMKKIRDESERPLVDEWKYVEYPFKDELSPDRTVPMIVLPTAGCQYSLEGGCTMCEFGFSSKLTEAEMKEQIEESIAFAAEKNKGHKMGFYNIALPGSFFDEKELSPESRKKIYESVVGLKSEHEVILFETESRLDTITKENLDEMREALGSDTIIGLGYGVESTNPLIRDGIVNKKIPDNYREIIKNLHEHKMDSIAHILLKPPYLTESEAIDDAVKSISDLIDSNDADIVLLMAMSVVPGTLVSKLSERGEYKKPSIWSIVEIIKRLGPDRLARTYFFGLQFEDEGRERVSGCNECDPVLMPLIKNFRGTTKELEELIEISEGISCNCKNEWQIALGKKERHTLAERVAKSIDDLSQEYLEKHFSDW